jgi:hypothetical protein
MTSTAGVRDGEAYGSDSGESLQVASAGTARVSREIVNPVPVAVFRSCDFQVN